jgi:ATPase subunit of ABC transporter with duplicated ATPase domains
LTVGYLPQEPDAAGDETLLGFLARRTGVAAAGARLDELTRALEHDHGLTGEHADALERFLALGGEDLAARAAEACARLGLVADRLDRPLRALSGGESARAALASLLLSRFDVFLLDEPTNDLDFAGLDVLEEFLASVRAAAVIVSHDRAFLDRTVTRIVELDEWTRGAVEFAGGWGDYEAARARALSGQYRAFSAYEAERARIEGEAGRMREWERRGYGQGRKKKKTKDVRKAFEHKLSRLEPVEKPYEPWQLKLSLAPERRSAEVVVRLERAVVERGTFRLGPLDLEVRWRDRLAIVGENGSGKTTLLETLLGRLPLAAGRLHLGAGVVLGELEQRRPTLGAGPLLAGFAAASGLPAEEARTLLAKFGLGADDVLRPAPTLSPGERTRATLALLVTGGVNCLVLDEPTNHLDLPAIEQFEAALEGFDGTVLLVTHDRRFLESFRATRTLELPASRARDARSGRPPRGARRDRPRSASSS